MTKRDEQTVNHAEGSGVDTVEGLIKGDDGRARCWWCTGDDAYRAYHDEEWGRPVDDDRRLFEKLCLEAFQAGLSWLTILRKRENFREAFHDFDHQVLAEWGDDEVEELLQNEGIVRNRQKIEAVLNNARQIPSLQEEFGSFSEYVWQYAPNRGDRPETIDRGFLENHTTSAPSKAMARDLKNRGWTFVGPTLTYSFMQAMGLVNDHLTGCWVREEVAELRARMVAGF